MLLLPSPISQPSVLSTTSDSEALTPPHHLLKPLILQYRLANFFNQPSEIIIDF